MPTEVVAHGGEPIAEVRTGRGCVLAVALHTGHEMRADVAASTALTDDERLREEDPHTALFAPGGIPLVAARRSRFEVDLNRPREKAVYRLPEDAWGLNLWREPLTNGQVADSLAVYDACYGVIEDAIDAIVAARGAAVVLDLHSYNHRRGGADALPDDPQLNPEVNLGTKRIDRERWAPVVSALSERLAAAGFDVRENVKFGGGHFAQWVTDRFGGRACVLSIEFKKTFMDEWTGTVDLEHVTRCRETLGAALPSLEAALAEVAG